MFGVRSGRYPEGGEMTVRVLIVDDQAPFRMAARAVVEATDDFDVVGEAETGEASVEMAHELKPDLVLMDVNLPGINGLEATRQILKDLVSLPVLQPDAITLSGLNARRACEFLRQLFREMIRLSGSWWQYN